ncbi:MAG: rRNA maturation RNase YbeY [Patescibacteria group bacterium]
MNKILTAGLESRFYGLENRVCRKAQKILKILKKDGFRAEIYLIGNGKMRILNKKFRHKDKATDILSFLEPKNFPHPENGKPKLKIKPIGEVYLNMDKIKDQETEAYLLIHGLLHLLGYDHKRENDRIKMEKKEQQTFKFL